MDGLKFKMSPRSYALLRLLAQIKARDQEPLIVPPDALSEMNAGRDLELGRRLYACHADLKGSRDAGWATAGINSKQIAEIRSKTNKEISDQIADSEVNRFFVINSSQDKDRRARFALNPVVKIRLLT